MHNPRKQFGPCAAQSRSANPMAGDAEFGHHRYVSVTVRRIRASDAALLKVVRLAALADAPSAFASTYEREAALTDDDWSERASIGSAGPLRSTFVAEAGSEVVGIVAGYRDAHDDTTVELVSMWVAPTHRRQHVGRTLVERVWDSARETDRKEVALWVTRGNVPAQALYRKLGFCETGDVQPLPSDPCKDELRLNRSLGQRA